MLWLAQCNVTHTTACHPCALEPVPAGVTGPGLNTSPFIALPHRDLLAYAIGIGCSDEKFLTHTAKDFEMFPTFPVSLFFKGNSSDAHDMRDNPVAELLNAPFLKDYGVHTGLDGARMIECVNPLPVEGGTFVWKTDYTAVARKTPHLAINEYETTMEDQEGKVYYRFWSAQASIGDIDEFDDVGESQSVSVTIPERAPDAVEAFQTSVLQSYMYSLTGDFNKPHVDNALGKKLGYGGVILQGLATCGISSRALLKTYGENATAAFHCVRVRFSKPVRPGQTLETQMWVDRDGSAAPGAPLVHGTRRVVFQTVCKETGDTVISNAYMDLRTVIADVDITSAKL